MGNIPLTALEDNLFRNFSKYNEHISRQLLKDVMHQLVCVVEKKIHDETITTRGAILHDGWTFMVLITSSCLCHTFLTLNRGFLTLQ